MCQGTRDSCPGVQPRGAGGWCVTCCAWDFVPYHSVLSIPGSRWGRERTQSALGSEPKAGNLCSLLGFWFPSLSARHAPGPQGWWGELSGNSLHWELHSAGSAGPLPSRSSPRFLPTTLLLFPRGPKKPSWEQHGDPVHLHGHSLALCLVLTTPLEGRDGCQRPPPYASVPGKLTLLPKAPSQGGGVGGAELGPQHSAPSCSSFPLCPQTLPLTETLARPSDA